MRVISRLLVFFWLFGQTLPAMAAPLTTAGTGMQHGMAQGIRAEAIHCTHMKNGVCCQRMKCRHCTSDCSGHCNMTPGVIRADACLDQLFPLVAQRGADAPFLPPEALTLFLRPPISAA